MKGHAGFKFKVVIRSCNTMKEITFCKLALIIDKFAVLKENRTKIRIEIKNAASRKIHRYFSLILSITQWIVAMRAIPKHIALGSHRVIVEQASGRKVLKFG